MTPAAIDLGSLLPPDLPSASEVVAEGRRIATDVDVGTTLYLTERQAASEIEYRHRAAIQGIPCTAINIGLNTWADTREALGLIYEDALRRGVRPPDRYELLAERRMGLPPELRADAPPETGPCLWTDRDWWELGNTVPIQPEAGDNMIGGPGSVPNAATALRAGVTTVGVASQFVWRWPYWDDEVAQLSAVVSAAAIIACKRDRGACLNGYIDDGFCGVFGDYASVLGWAMLERYVFEDLLGAPYSVSWGGLTADPMHKAVVTMALDAVNPHRVPPAYIQGDTISHTEDPGQNFAGVSVDVMMTKLVCARYRIAAAQIAVPVTETVRIPSWEEIAEVHAVNRRIEDYLPSMEAVIDWRALEAQRDQLVLAGRRVFGRFVETAAATGVDTQDALQMLLVMKRIGADMFERSVGAGAANDRELTGRDPVLRTDLVSKTMTLRDQAQTTVRERFGGEALSESVVVVASSDVHHFALFLLRSVLQEAGAKVIDIGVSRDPEDIVKVAIETAADAIAITTHNGVARSYGMLLRQRLSEAGCRTPVFMGGVLNEDDEDSPTPIDVRGQLRAEGIQTPDDLPALIAAMRESHSLA